MSELPSFDDLLELAKNNPEELENLRKNMIEEIIEAASTDEQKRKLRGLQFKIDAERIKARTPMGACIKISKMMTDSFVKLKDAVNSLQESNPNKVKVKKEEIIPLSSTVIDFKRKE